MSNGADVFLVCVLIALAASLLWREILYALAVLSIAMVCMAVFYVALGIQSVTQAS